MKKIILIAAGVGLLIYFSKNKVAPGSARVRRADRGTVFPGRMGVPVVINA